MSDLKRYESRPTTVQAYQLTREILDNHILDQHELIDVTIVSSQHHKENRTVSYSRQTVRTMQDQDVRVEPGEWIVREPDGIHFYPVADEIFKAKYTVKL